jgi:hypothetical protein
MRMNPYLSFRRLGLLFMAIFAVLVAGVVAFERFWVGPGDRCENNGGWYDISTRTCATPIYIPDITGRAEGVSRAEASEQGARDILVLEDRIAAQKAAQDAEADRQRAIYEAQKRGE